MRLLVDGLNTQPDVEKDDQGRGDPPLGQHGSLADATHTVLDPATLAGARKVWGVRGFATQTGEHGRVRQFVVNTAAESLAARRKYTQDMGLITAAFYDPNDRGSLRHAGSVDRHRCRPGGPPCRCR